MQLLGMNILISFNFLLIYLKNGRMQNEKDILILIYPYSKKIQIKDEGCNS